MSAVRSTTLTARLWWALLPAAGSYGYAETRRQRLLWLVPNLLWQLVRRLPGSDPFEPMEPVICDCDYCRGVPAARFEP